MKAALGKIIDGRKRLRIFHFANQDGVCAYCGDLMTSIKGLNLSPKACTLEHIFPRTYGGKDTLTNTIGVCSECNTERASKKLKLHMILGIILFKGTDAIIPISQNYIHEYKAKLFTNVGKFLLYI